MAFSKQEDILMACFSIDEEDFETLQCQQQLTLEGRHLQQQQTPAGVLDSGEAKSSEDASHPLLQQTQQKVGEVIGIMMQNVDRVMERDEQCAVLNERVHDLEIGAAHFETTSNRLVRKKCIPHLKTIIILAMVCAVLIIISLMAIWPAKTRVEQHV